MHHNNEIYKNVTLKTVEMLLNWHQTQNDSPTLLLMQWLFKFQKILTGIGLLNLVSFLFVSV